MKLLRSRRTPAPLTLSALHPRPALTSIDAAQCFPFYTYAEDATNRRENITDSALEQFRSRYHDPSITQWDIFHYIYAVLHTPSTANATPPTSAANSLASPSCPRQPSLQNCHPEHSRVVRSRTILRSRGTPCLPPPSNGLERSSLHGTLSPVLPHRNVLTRSRPLGPEKELCPRSKRRKTLENCTMPVRTMCVPSAPSSKPASA